MGSGLLQLSLAALKIPTGIIAAADSKIFETAWEKELSLRSTAPTS